MILNHRKYYDMDDYLISPENINYEFEKDDIYTINLSVIPTTDERSSEDNIKYKNNGESHIYRLNEYTYSLKLKSSKAFYNQIKSNHKNYGFDISLYNHDTKNRMGIKECLNNNILDAMLDLSKTNRTLLETLDERGMNIVDDIVANFVNENYFVFASLTLGLR